MDDGRADAAEPLRILIVEDEALLLMQLETTVEDEGHEIVGTAMSSGEAIAMARLVEPDIAFIDLQLLDGPTGNAWRTVALGSDVPHSAGRAEDSMS